VAWTAPMTAVANAVFTAAQFNTHIRDNLNETAPAKATTAGRLFVSTGVNSIAERVITEATVATSQSTTSTSAVDLATVGPQVTVTTGTSALVMWSCETTTDVPGQSAYIDFKVTGASLREAESATALRFTPSTNGYAHRAGTFIILTGLTAGSNTFTLKYWAGGGGATGFFANRRIIVLGL
jgi:hypothetical protein